MWFTTWKAEASRCRARHLSGQLELGSQVGSHHRPTWSHMEPNEAFDFCDITGIRLQSATPADDKDLVRIEGVRGSNPLSSTERFSRLTCAYLHVWV
jgi:hypothetical protein